MFFSIATSQVIKPGFVATPLLPEVSGDKYEGAVRSQEKVPTIGSVFSPLILHDP